METKFKTRSKNDKECYIQVQFTNNGKRFVFSTPYTTPVKDWQSGYPKQIAQTKNLRSNLDDLKRKTDIFINDHISRYSRYPSKIEISEVLAKITGKTTTEGLQGLLDRYYKHKQSVLSIKASTLQQIKATFALLKEYRPAAEIADINREFAEGFTAFLISSGLLNSTINKHHKNVKAFCNWIYSHDITGTNLGKYFVNLKAQEKPIIALTLAEVETLENAKLKTSWSKVRDLFLFSCYTGLRFEDLAQVSKQKVSDNVLTIRQQKTNALISIPLLTSAIAILQRYHYELPRISNQKANEYLKEIFKHLELDRDVIVRKHEDSYEPLSKAVSFHVSRKTFVTLALSKGIPSKIVQAISGHKDDQIFNSYINFSKTLLQQEMTKLERPAAKVKKKTKLKIA